jgi:hypothetical protein
MDVLYSIINIRGVNRPSHSRGQQKSVSAYKYKRVVFGVLGCVKDFSRTSLLLFLTNQSYDVRGLCFQDTLWSGLPGSIPRE